MDSRPPLLYVVHRIPYPPNKGDKVRSFNILRHLARSHRVYLGTFVDHPDDRECIGPLGQWCAGIHAVELNPRRARLASLRGLFTGEALSLPYYRDGGMRAWVHETVRNHGIRRAVAFSGPMAQYLDAPGLARCIVDFCDLDSAKWIQYAARRPWPMSWLYRREGERLLVFERTAARAAEASLFVTDAEAALFCHTAPDLADRIVSMRNGVDAEFFSPGREYPNPYPDRGPVVVFTGAMDYWPNVDAVTWFVHDILPVLHRARPAVRFYVVGMNPAPAVVALAGPAVVVTGSVPDVRPWLAHADLVAAPLRIARGLQNKVLEAMAMGKPVVTSAASAAGLEGRPGLDFDIADGAAEFAERIDTLLGDAARRRKMGQAARARVLADYSWDAHLGRLDRLLGERPDAGQSQERARRAWSDTDARPLIVHVVYAFHVGGLENGVANLINHLPAARFRHAVVALTDCSPDFCARVVHDDVQFISLQKEPGHGIRLYPALYRLFRALRPAIVHTRNLAALEAVVPAWAAGVPVRIHGEHGWDVSDPHGIRLRFRLIRRAYRRFVTHYVALSNHLRAYLTENVGVAPDHVTRICNGVDTARFRPAAAGRHRLDGLPFKESGLRVVGTVGRLQAIKDPLNLVHAFALLVARDPALAQRLRLVIVGDGPLRGEIEAEIAAAGIGDRVWLAGEREDVPEIMRAMDIFVLPSRAEGISNTILEAMASGLPVIATQVGGNHELVLADETGSLVPPGDAAALADTLAYYATDDAMAAARGRSGRRRVEGEFSIDGMVGRYADLYESLLDAAGLPVLAT